MKFRSKLTMTGLYDFASLIRRFLNNEITVQQFERTYIDEFSGSGRWGKFFGPLEYLFFRVDAYTDLPFEEGDDPNDHINEDQLRESARKTLDDLERLGWEAGDEKKAL